MVYHEKLGEVWWTNQEWSILTYVKIDNIFEAFNVIKNDKQKIDGLCKANLTYNMMDEICTIA